MKNAVIKLTLIISLCLVFCMLLSSCKSTETKTTTIDSIKDYTTADSKNPSNTITKKDDVTNMPTNSVNQTKTISDFSFIKYNMDRASIESVLGKPDEIVGSGIPIPQYNLADGSFILLHFSVQSQKLISAVHYNKDGTNKELLGK